MTFKPSPQLARAVRSALQVFARHRPTIFRLANEESDAGSDFVADYARALLGVSLEAIPDAAQRWVAQRSEIPGAASFGAFARAIDKAEYRAPQEESSYRQSSLPVPEFATNRDFGAIDRFYAMAKEQLLDAGYRGSVLVAVSQMWAILYGSQEGHVTDDNGNVRLSDGQQAIHDARFDDSIWQSGINAWLAGERPTPHPLNNFASALGM